MIEKEIPKIKKAFTEKICTKELFCRNKTLIFLLVVGGLLRLLGLRHGFPFIFHPDEPSVIRSALGIRFFPNPDHFDWPHLYFYLNYFLYMGFSGFRNFLEALRLKPFISDIFPLIWNDPLIFYYLTRLFSATLGTLTIIPLYLSGKELFGKRGGILAASILAIFPYHVWHSHYSVIDVPMLFFFAWAVYFSIKVLFSDKLLHYILAGAFVGLAASTKYHGGFSAFFLGFVFFAKYLSSKDFPGLLKNSYKPFLAGITSLVTFLLGTPFALLDWETFSSTDSAKGAFWQFTNVGSVSFNQQIFQFLNAFIDKFMHDWSITFVFAFLLAAGYAVYILFRQKEDIALKTKLLALFVPAFTFLVYISGFEKNRSHYYMIAYPFVILGISWFLLTLEKFSKSKEYVMLLFVVFAFPVVLSVKNMLMFALKDTRVVLHDWYGMRLDLKSYKFYSDSDELKASLTGDGGSAKSPEDYVIGEELSPPYVLVKQCSSDKEFKDQKPFKVIENTLRRGPEICIYVQD
ncbi:phospholipid carrier-dependent glycosyltransferase [candidate division WWE3 bacterium]|nr:phospholipid carrier-dependent glycosyltransferase [candidate division WWE3 bacterium]